MTVQSTYQLLSCCIEGPPGYRVKARYALRMLLAPFRFDPRPASRDDAPALYYGPGDAPNGALALPSQVLRSTARPASRSRSARRSR